MFDKLAKLFKKEEPIKAVVKKTTEKMNAINKKSSFRMTQWTDEELEELGYSGLSASKLKINVDVIRKTMDRSGWNAYETFCRMLEICEKKNVSFPDIYKDGIWKDYQAEQADDLVNQVEPNVLDVVEKKKFEDRFYSKKQKRALMTFRSGVVTVEAIEDYMGIKLPEDIEGWEGDVKKRVSFQLKTLKTGDLFLCVPDKYIVKDTLMRIKPACVVGYPSYENIVKEAGIPFVPCKQFSSFVLDLAGLWVKNYDAKVVSITGSVGKTSTTDMIGCVVSAAYNMHKVVGNQNTTWQIVDFAFKLERAHEVYVQECSGSFPGQMEKSSRVLQTDLFVLTNIGNGHIGRYGGKQQRLLYEKVALDRHGAENATGIVNWDDALLNRITFRHPVQGFSMKDPAADFYSEDVVEQDGVITFRVVEKDGTRTPVVLNVVGIHNVYNALAAFAVGVKLGIDRAVIAKALATFETAGARQNLVNYAGQKLYIDCCSATEESMKSAVMAMKSITVPEGCRKIAVLADVQMLGDQSEEIHRRIGQMIIQENHADEIFFYGPEMRYAMEEVQKAGIPCKNTSSREELERWIREETRPGDLITFKAGHIMACQWVIDDIWGTNLYLHDKFTTNAPIVKEGDSQYKCIEDYGCALQHTDKSASDVVLVDRVNGMPLRVVDDGVFRKSDVQDITITDSVVCIGDSAFKDCTKLKKVEFPASLKYIGASAFAGCTGIEAVDLSKGCETIDADAFKDCDNLKKVIMPVSLKSIHPGAFDSDYDGVIQCAAGSYAEAWAEDKSYRIVVE